MAMTDEDMNLLLMLVGPETSVAALDLVETPGMVVKNTCPDTGRSFFNVKDKKHDYICIVESSYCSCGSTLSRTAHASTGSNSNIGDNASNTRADYSFFCKHLV